MKKSRKWDAKTAEAALTKLRGVIEQVEDVVPARVPILEVVEVARALADKAQESVAQLEEVFAAPPLEALEQLGTLALALWEAQTQLERVRKIKEPQQRQALLAEGYSLQRLLADAAHYLWSRDARLKDRVREIRRGRGHQDMANDLVAYVDLFEENWDEAKNNCRLTKADLKRAGELAPTLLSLLAPQDGEQEQAAMLLRDQAWTLLERTYDTVARAFLFVQPDAAQDFSASLRGDAGKLLLSRQRSKKKPAAPAEQPDTPAPSAESE